MLLKWASSYTHLHHVPVTFERCGSNMFFMSRLPVIFDRNEANNIGAITIDDDDEAHSNLPSMPSYAQCWNELLRMTRTYDLHVTSPQQFWFSFGLPASDRKRGDKCHFLSLGVCGGASCPCVRIASGYLVEGSKGLSSKGKDLVMVGIPPCRIPDTPLDLLRELLRSSTPSRPHTRPSWLVELC